MMEGSVPCFERDGNGSGKCGALGCSQRLSDGLHIACKAGNGQDVRGLAVILAPNVAAWNVLQGMRYNSWCSGAGRDVLLVNQLSHVRVGAGEKGNVCELYL